MLKTMRKQARIFLYILIVAFVVWLAADVILTGQRTPYAGIIFGKKILFSEYQKAWEATRTKAIFTYGDAFRNIAKDLNLDDEAWDRLILLYEAKRHKLRTDDAEVVNYIKDIPVFKDKNGRFDQKTYEYILKYTFGLTPRDFEEQVREELTIKKLLDKQNEKITVTDEEVLNAYKMANEKAKAAYILFETEQYIPKVACTEDELKEHFEKNKQSFDIPEKVNVEYFGANYEKETDEIKDKARNQMEEISKEISESNDFATVAKKHSLQLKETGFFSREDKIPEIGWALNFTNVAFSLKPQEISNPVEVKNGIYILRLKEKSQSRPGEFSEVKEKVEKSLKKQKAEEEAKTKTKEALTTIKAKIEGKEKFENAAKELSLKVAETQEFTRTTYIEGLGFVKEFIDAVFSLKEGEVFNEPVKVHNGYAILKLNALIPIDENKYKEEKDKFKEQILAQKRYFNLIKWVYELRKSAALKSNLENLKQ